MDIGERLKLLRKSAGLTQDEVAERLFLTRQALSSYETGRTRPDIDTLLKLAEIYGTDLSGLVYESEPVLKHYERLKRWARVLLIAVALLALAAALLPWIAQRFFAVTPGPVSPESRSVLEAHFAITSAGELAEGLSLVLSFCGELALSLCAALYCRHIPFRKKGLYTLVLAGLPLLTGLLFGLSPYSLSLTNYLIQPVYLAAQAGIMLLLNVLICRRRKKAP